MSWRNRFLLWFGPSILGGITFGDWLALLRENRFAVDPSYWLRAASITMCSLGNSLDRRREEARYGQEIRDTMVDPPVFVLGICAAVPRISRISSPSMSGSRFPTGIRSLTRTHSWAPRPRDRGFSAS